MLVWKRWVFPILLLILVAAIAVALVRLAFFSDTASNSESTPGSEVVSPTVIAENHTIVNELALRGTVARDSDVSIRSHITGTITAVHVGVGSAVAAGQPLATVKQDYPVASFDILAPEAGTITEFTPVAGQPISIGDAPAKLSPNRFHVLATVEPVQLYRLIGAPSEAKVTITGGPAPFVCNGLSTEVSTEGTASVRCNIPVDQVVFPGLPVQLDVAVGIAEDTLAIPATAVKGGSGSGIVWIPSADGGDPTERKVALGVSDGTLVQVLEGLEAGEQVLQFVPGAAAPVEEFCYEIAPGEEFCEQGVNW